MFEVIFNGLSSLLFSLLLHTKYNDNFIIKKLKIIKVYKKEIGVSHGYIIIH